MQDSDLEMIKNVCLHETKETGEDHNLVITNPINGKYVPEKGSRYEIFKADIPLGNNILVYTSDQLLYEESLRDEENEELII